MFGRLDAVLRAIARDRRSGAGELARRACRHLQCWLRHRPPAGEILRVAVSVHRAQPGMAPLLRLANELAWPLERGHPTEAVLSRIEALHALLESSPARIAQHCARALAGNRLRIATYSFSSTTLAVLLQLRNRLAVVYCSEGRPDGEGRRMASQLVAHRIAVEFCTDMVLISLLAHADALLVGADAVLSSGFVNKIGTATLAGRAGALGIPVLIAADSSKFCPPRLARALHWTRVRPAPNLWPRPAARLRVVNPVFEQIRWQRGMRIVTEQGIFRPSQLRRQLAAIPVARVLASIRH